MTNILKTSNSKLRFSHIALALSLSLGTVGGMMSFAVMSQPALAAAAGGGGNGGGGGAGGANGGEGGNVMAVTHNTAPNNPNRVTRSRPATPNGCTTPRDTPDLQNCHYNEPRAPRIVNIHGFANCAVIGQVPGSNGRGEYYCIRPM